MKPEELAQHLALGREQTSVEFKGPGLRSERPFMARVTRAVLGMANATGGGWIAIGIDEADGRLIPTGLSDEQLPTWSHDECADFFAAYADPPVEFELSVVELQGRRFIAIRVEQFRDVPIVCKKTFSNEAGKPILREGACYVRGRRKPETVEVGTQADMRALLDVATTLRLREFVSQATAAGIRLTVNPSEDELEDSRFAEEWNQALSEVPANVTSRGWWRISVRPRPLHPRAGLTLRELEELVRTLEFPRRGWAFPFVLRNEPFNRTRSSISQAVESGSHVEWWTLRDSGLFVSAGGIRWDWRDVPDFFNPPPPDDWSPGRAITVPESMSIALDAYQFAARLGASRLGAPQMQVSLHWRGLRDRQLLMELPGVSPLRSEGSRFSVDEFGDSHWFDTATLIEEPNRLAAAAVCRFFELAGWDLSVQYVLELIRKLGD